MKKVIVPFGVGLLLLTGAGCATSVPETDTATTAADQNSSQNTSQQAANRDQAAEPETTSDSVQQNSSEKGVAIDDDAARNFFNNDRTDAQIMITWKQYSKLSTRMTKDVIAASPQGIKVYEKEAWVSEDGPGAAMVQVGQDAALAMLEAHRAFEDDKPVVGLVAKAKSLTSNWDKAIGTFEAKWGVRN